MSSTSSGFSSNSSSSTPVVVSTPENSILDQIAQYASSLAPQMLDWANNAYSQTSQVTNEAVSNFLNTSQQMQQFGGNLISQYNTEVAPELSQLVTDANSYASPERMKADMGMAGATQAQAGDQSIKNSEQNLLSYGINPADGRYASLDKAAAVQNAANVAGAQNTQRVSDINTGQQLRAEALQFGSLLPGAASNAENTAIQANAGASNASLANANTGANLMDVADKYLNTAMGLKLSPTGQKSSGYGSSSNSSQSSGGGGSGGGGGGNGGGGSSPWGPGDGGLPADQGNSDNISGSDGGTTYGGGAQPDAGVYYPTSMPGGLADAGGGDWSDTGGGGSLDFGGSGGGGSDSASFAQGGAIPDDASPSGGAQVDDVPAQMPSGGPARLNANEFVVPRDVAEWKGQEFFHKLIAQSRMTRQQMAAATGVGAKARPIQGAQYGRA